MKAATIVGPGAIRVADEPVPEIGPKEVLTRVKYAGICGTDFSIYNGSSPFLATGQIKYPVRPGHEWSGIVAAVGAEVRDFKPGDAVTGDNVVSCGECAYCMSGHYNVCGNVRCVGTVNTWDGAFAEYMIMPARHMFAIPQGLSLEAAAFAEPAAIALYAARHGRIGPGDTVVVHGTGTIGLLALQFAKAAGAACVILTGLSDSKLEIGRRVGADIPINVSNANATERILAATGGKGADTVIEASGATSALEASVYQTRPGGVISVIGSYEHKSANFDFNKLVLHDITIKGLSGGPGEFTPAMKLMTTGRIDVKPLITHRYSLDQAEEAMRTTEHDENRIKVLLQVMP